MADPIKIDPKGGNVTWTIEADDNLTMIIVYSAYVKDKNGDVKQEWENKDTYHGIGNHEINLLTSFELSDGSRFTLLPTALDPSGAGGEHSATLKFFQNGAQIGDDRTLPVTVPANGDPSPLFGELFEFQKNI